MKRVIFLLFWLPWLGSSSYAQQYFPSEVWHEGKVNLLDGQELRGKIKYNFEADVIQLSADNTIQTFGARQLLAFEIFDEEYGRYRQFFALPYQVSSSYKVPRLFEVLYENTLTLLSRETIEQETVPQYSYYGPQYGGTRQRLAYEYYFLGPEGEIARYSQKKDELYQILADHRAEMRQFIKTNRLKHDRRSDLVRITAYYNELLNS